MAFSDAVITTAQHLGVPGSVSGNVVRTLLFTLGCVVNVAYCLYLMAAKGTLRAYWSNETARNVGLSAVMALMWIGSFYLYGAGASKLGRWGAVVGWPLFISLSIVTGNLWGIWRGEWQGAPRARRLLNAGLAVLLIAVVTIALSNAR